jgi:hypothetical protein
MIDYARQMLTQRCQQLIAFHAGLLHQVTDCTLTQSSCQFLRADWTLRPAGNPRARDVNPQNRARHCRSRDATPVQRPSHPQRWYVRRQVDTKAPAIPQHDRQQKSLRIVRARQQKTGDDTGNKPIITNQRKPVTKYSRTSAMLHSRNVRVPRTFQTLNRRLVWRLVVRICGPAIGDDGNAWHHHSS